MTTFLDRLERASQKNNSILCVGLDPDASQFPGSFKGRSDRILDFCKGIVDATADAVCAFKPQIAHFSAVGAEPQLRELIKYIKNRFPEIPVILDAKRGDIGSTSEMYAREAFDHYDADAVTVNPYLGTDSLQPFLERKDRGVIVLCRTSNSGAGTFQDLTVSGRKIYHIVAETAVQTWNQNQNVLLVVGATYPQELKEIRSIAPKLTFLVPGFGTQGGSASDIIANGARADGGGLIVNSSRAIIYAGKDDHFAELVRQKALQSRDELNKGRRLIS